MGARGMSARVKKARSKGRHLIGSTKPPKVLKDAITRITRGRSPRSPMTYSAVGKSPRRTMAVQTLIPATDSNAKTASQSTQPVTLRKRSIGTTSLVHATICSGTLPSKRTRSQVIPYQSPFSVQAIPGSSKSPPSTPIHVNAENLKSAAKNSAISPQKKNDVSNKQNSNIKISPKNIKSIKKMNKAKSSISAADSAKKKATTSKTKVKAQKKGKRKLSLVVSKNNSPNKKRPVKPVGDDNTVSTSTEQDSKKEKKTAAKKPRAKLKKNDENNNDKVKTKRKGRAERLNPKPFVTEYLEDPTYRSREPIPHISTLANSRLLIRAILLEDNELLESLLTNESSICSLKIPRSLQTDTNALGYALERENLAAIKMLVEKGKTIKLAPFPNLMIMEESTGSNSTYMLGHAVRSVQVGRGGKEGNSALLKDSGLYTTGYYNAYRGTPCINNDTITTALKLGLKFSTIQELGKLGSSDVDYMCSENVITAIRFGHNHLAGEIVKHSRENDKWFSLNLLHEETLLNTTKPLTPFKASSVIKKSRTDKLTPLHCAAINPNPDYLIQLLEVYPDMEVYDKHKFGPVHYASVCSGNGPLEVLLSRGASIVQTTKAGDTPLLLAAATGRIENIKLILAHAKKTEHLNQSGKSVSCLERKTKSGLTALQLAAEKGYLDAVKVLIDGGANPNGFTSADYGKLTPLMLAAQEGHLHVMKYLIEHGVKIDTVNLRGKSALTLAVMNGQAHVVSYLLRLGANHLIKDTSGNTLIHYAAAYGWYFNLKLLLEAGCSLNEGNTWKMTPVTIAFMKGHMGIVEFILQQCAVNINFIINDSNGATLLLQTCMGTPNSDYYSQIKFLLEEQKADVHVTDFDKNTAMHYVVKNAGRTSEDETKKWLLDTLKLLIDKGSDPDAKNADNNSPMNLAIQKNDFFLIQKLLEFNCPLSTETDQQGNNLLHNIMSNVISDDAIELYKTCSENPKHLEIKKEMVNVQNKNGDPPLFHLFRRNPNYQAKHERLLDCLRFLLNTLEADVTVTDSKGKSHNLIFHVIVETGYTHSALNIILPRHPDLEALDQHKQTPLAMAISRGDIPAAENLVNAGANVNAKLPNGNSLLIELAKKFSAPHVGLFKLMIEKGANFLDKDIHNQNTILHYMVRHSSSFEAIALVDQLIKAGVSINAVNGQGRTPLHEVINTRGGETDTNFEIEDLLIKTGAKLDIRDHRQRIPLHYAFVKINRHSDQSFMDPIELVSTLVGAMKNSVENFTHEIKQSDEFGKTPLHYAASRGASICCSYLSMLMNTEIDVLDNNGNTPLGLAVYSGHEGCSVQFTQLGANFKLPLYSTSTHTSNTSTIMEQKSWKWHYLTLKLEEEKKRIVTRNPSILEEVIKKDWQGILYLMLETLNKSGTGSSLAIAAAINSGRLKLADKLVYRALPSELTTTKGDVMR